MMSNARFGTLKNITSGFNLLLFSDNSQNGDFVVELDAREADLFKDALKVGESYNVNVDESGDYKLAPQYARAL